MALNAKKISGDNNKKFAPQANIEPGVYPARLVQILDLGLQPQRPFQGKDKPPVNELMLTYELVDEFMKGEDGKDIEDKPRWISETFPFHGLFADKAKSTVRYHALDPKEVFEGDWSKLIGTPCNVTVVNNQVGDKVYDNISNVGGMRPRDAQACPELKNESKVFDLEEPDMEIFNKLPKWIQDKMKGNLNYQGSSLQAKLGEKKEEKKEAPPESNIPADMSDDIPY